MTLPWEWWPAAVDEDFELVWLRPDVAASPDAIREALTPYGVDFGELALVRVRDDVMVRDELEGDPWLYVADRTLEHDDARIYIVAELVERDDVSPDELNLLA